ncbi:hypothetical protein [Bradyrhizobium sp. USDA 336]|uniref:hypothetical protein n=1 Tax=Bradyrhizobium sp. USDA 336 TaxID=3156311 RepID=UPI003837BCE7
MKIATPPVACLVNCAPRMARKFLSVDLGYVVENPPEATCVLIGSDGQDLPVTIRDLSVMFCGVVDVFQVLSLSSWPDLMRLNPTSDFLVSVVMQAVVSYYGNRKLV